MTDIHSHFDNPDLLTPESEVLIYQSLRDFTDKETVEMKEILIKFTERWNRGGTVHSATFGIFYSRFIVIAAIRDTKSGVDCSLDTPSNQTIRRLERKFGLSLMTSMQVSYKTRGEIITLPLGEFKEKILEEGMPEDAIVFQNHVKTIKEFEESWEMPFHKSWASTLIPDEIS